MKKETIRLAVVGLGGPILVFSCVALCQIIFPSQPAPSRIPSGDPHSFGSTSLRNQAGQDSAVTELNPTPQAKSVIVDADLKQLAKNVGIDNLANEEGWQTPKLEAWEKSREIARDYLTRQCDCDQVNWLNQFIQCGTYALQGDVRYQEAVKSLSTINY